MRRILIFFIVIIAFIGSYAQDLETQLFSAIKNIDYYKVKKLIDEGVDLNCRNKYGYTPLLDATDQPRKEIAKLLIESGADINAISWNSSDTGWTALHLAIYYHLPGIATLLINKGADINAKAQDRIYKNCTPLCMAIENNMPEIAELLIDRGAEINVTCNCGRYKTVNPLILAVYEEDYRLTEKLLKNGANPKVFCEYLYLFLIGVAPVHIAAYYGNTDILKLLLEYGADINLKSKRHRTPLDYASSSGNRQTVKFLLEQNARIVYDDIVLSFADSLDRLDLKFFKAIDEGKIFLIKKFLDKGFDVNFRTAENLTPLHITAYKGQLKIASLLIEYGANPNATDDWGQTPLFYAVSKDNFKMAKLLVKNGTDLSFKDSSGVNALYYAISNGNKKIVKLLVRKKQNDTSYLNSVKEIALAKANPGIIRFLIRKGLTFDINNFFNAVPLFVIEASTPEEQYKSFKIICKHSGYGKCTGDLLYPAIFNNTKIAKLISKHIDSVKVRDDFKKELLIRAVKQKDMDLIKILIKWKMADINAATSYENTPLEYAVKKGYKRIAKFLVKNGGEVKGSSLVFAIENGRKDLVIFLLKHGADPNEKHIESPWELAIKQEDKKLIKILLKYGADINKPVSFGETALCYALDYEHPAIAEYLIKKGADANLGSPLIFAAKKGYYKISEILLQKGADVNVKSETYDYYFWTPLHFAVLYGDYDLAKLFIASGADVNVRNRNGETPLSFAVQNKDYEMLRLLSDNNANPNIADINGFPPLFFAVKNNDLTSYYYLTKHGADTSFAAKFGLSFSGLVKNFDASAIYNFLKNKDFEIFPLFDIGQYDTLLRIISAKPSLAALQNSEGKTILHLCVDKNNLQLLRNLIAINGIDINATDKNGNTPLLWAIKTGKTEIANFLIKNLADINKPDKNGYKPLYVAWQTGNKKIAGKLEKLNADGSPPPAIPSVKRKFSGKVNVLAVSPGGKYFATATFDYIVWLWDASTGKVLKIFDGNKSEVRQLAFSPDGNFIASVTENGVVNLWNIHTGDLVVSFDSRVNYADLLVFSPDGEKIIVSDEKYQRIWDLKTQKLLVNFHNRKEYAEEKILFYVNSSLAKRKTKYYDRLEENFISAAWTPDAKFVAFEQDSFLKVINIRTKSVVSTLTGNFSNFSFSPDGNFIINTDYLKADTIEIWNLKTGKNKIFPQNASRVSFVKQRFFKDKIAFIADSSVLLFDLHSGKTDTFFTDTTEIKAFAISDNGKYFAITGENYDTIKILQTKNKNVVKKFSGYFGRFINPEFLFGDSLLIVSSATVCGEYSAVLLWDIKTGLINDSLRKNTQGYPFFEASPDGKFIINESSYPHNLRLFDTKTGKLLKQTQFSGDQKFLFRFTNDSRYFFVVPQYNANCFYLYKVPELERVRIYCGNRENGEVFDVSPDDSVFAIAEANTIKLWDISKGEVVVVLKGHKSRIVFLSFLNDKELVSMDYSGDTKVWDLPEKREQKNFLLWEE